MCANNAFEKVKKPILQSWVSDDGGSLGRGSRKSHHFPKIQLERAVFGLFLGVMFAKGQETTNHLGTPPTPSDIDD